MARRFSLVMILSVVVLLVGTATIQSSSRAAIPQTHPARVHYINVGQADAILVELDKAALMIDAGGEATNIPEEKIHLVSYLTRFFNSRPDLNRTIHSIIISHPHIDHTKMLMDVVSSFRVNNLIDGGDEAGSGMVPLRAARQFVRSHRGNYFAIKDEDVINPRFSNPALQSLHNADPTVDVRLLSGSRGCDNANNSSLVVLLSCQAGRFIFTGDAEDEGASDCTDEISELIQRYQGTRVLNADVFKVDHHGSRNGVDEDWMQAIAPRVSIISAGQVDEPHRIPGQFHAFQFGHPREEAIRKIEAGTSDHRTPAANITTMDAVRRIHPNRRMERAVYCTCWDGDIVVERSPDGRSIAVRTAR